MVELKKYLRNRLHINVAILLIAFIFYFLIPDIDILGIIRDFKTLSSELGSTEAIFKIIDDKYNEVLLFLKFVKVILACLLYLIMFSISYVLYSQKNAQKNIIELSSNIEAINNTLETHFEDYRVFLDYSRMQDSVIHHRFEEALQYDIAKIDELKKGNTFMSTVIFHHGYLQEMQNHELLAKYLRSLKSAAEREVQLTRIYITENILSKDQKEHLDEFAGSGISVKLISINKLNEVSSLSFDLSKNFVIIDNKEVAFAYPFYGRFKFAVNIIKNGSRETVRYFKDYQSLFNTMSCNAVKWEV